MRTLIAALLILAAVPAAAMPRTTTEEDLRQFIEGLRTCQYDENDVTSRIAKSIHRHCETVKEWFDEVGEIVSIRFIATNDKRRADLYLVVFEHRWAA